MSKAKGPWAGFDQDSLLNRFVDFWDPAKHRHRVAKVVGVRTRKRFAVGYRDDKHTETKDAVKVKFHTGNSVGLAKTVKLIPLDSIRLVYLKAGPHGRRSLPFDEWVADHKEAKA